MLTYETALLRKDVLLPGKALSKYSNGVCFGFEPNAQLIYSADNLSNRIPTHYSILYKVIMSRCGYVVNRNRLKTGMTGQRYALTRNMGVEEKFSFSSSDHTRCQMSGSASAARPQEAS